MRPSRSAPCSQTWSSDNMHTQPQSSTVMPIARRRVRDFLVRLKQATSGSAGVEFGFIAPGLILLAVCTGDLGLGIYRKIQVQNAAQAGANYAAARGFNASSVAAAITGA